MIYNEPLPTYGDLMTVQEYLQQVDSGMFIDYDGMALPVKDNKVGKSTKIVLNGIQSFIYPSDRDTYIPKDATHIVWFNR